MRACFNVELQLPTYRLHNGLAGPSSLPRRSHPRIGCSRGQLNMKTTCEGCSRHLQTDGEAFICSYECTFCADCAFRQQGVCSHCGGELVRRPRRAISTPSAEENETEIPIA